VCARVCACVCVPECRRRRRALSRANVRRLPLPPPPITAAASQPPTRPEPHHFPLQCTAAPWPSPPPRSSFYSLDNRRLASPSLPTPNATTLSLSLPIPARDNRRRAFNNSDYRPAKYGLGCPQRRPPSFSMFLFSYPRFPDPTGGPSPPIITTQCSPPHRDSPLSDTTRALSCTGKTSPRRSRGSIARLDRAARSSLDRRFIIAFNNAPLASSVSKRNNTRRQRLPRAQLHRQIPLPPPSSTRESH
jgi:hypothetical protein